MSLATSACRSARELSDSAEGWPIERIVSLLAGGVTLASLGLARVHDPRWRILTGLVGGNLVLQGAVGWCPASVAMRMAGMRAAGEPSHAVSSDVLIPAAEPVSAGRF
jgi:uncharacterized membrane protein